MLLASGGGAAKEQQSHPSGLHTELTSNMVKSSVLVAAATPRELAQFLPLRYDSNDPGPSCPFCDTKRYKPTAKGGDHGEGTFGPRHGSANPIGGTIVGGAKTATAGGGAVAEADNPTQTREGRWRGGCGGSFV